MILRNRWFRLVPALAISVAFAVLGYLCWSGTGPLMASAKRCGVAPDNVVAGLVFFCVALASFAFFLSHDFLCFGKRDPVGFRLFLSALSALLYVVAALLVMLAFFGYSDRQEVLAKFGWSSHNYTDGTYFFPIDATGAFSAALLLFPFGLTYIVTGVLNSIILPKGETPLLPFVQLIGLVVSYFLGYILVYFCHGFGQWLYLVFLLLVAAYFFVVELGIKPTDASNIDKSADRLVVGAMEKVKRASRGYSVLSGYGVELWYKPSLSIRDGDVTFTVNYSLRRMENVKSETAAAEVKRSFESEMKNKMENLMNRAERELKKLKNTEKTYYVTVVPGHEV